MEVKELVKKIDWRKVALYSIVAFAFVAVVSVVAPALASGGSEWSPLWQKVQSYLTGIPGKIAATFFVAAAIFAFYRGTMAQGVIAILAATALVLSPKIANSIASGLLF